MNFLPFENITFETKLTEDEAIKRLINFIDFQKPFSLENIFVNSSTKPYVGQIAGQNFSIQRNIKYRNSFRPEIKGTIKYNVIGTLINIKMGLHPLIIAFLCIWCGGILLTCITIIVLNSYTGGFVPLTLVPFGVLFLLFAYGITMGGFKFESNKAKKDLQTLFDAEIVKQ